ncbi:hypothetical protein HU200_022390 [Digitaria exilis]|uniref:Dof zinc finger protein n=1 Tax=Digitaria exilis TaxID=1010633 RepID=A0A835CAQ6_9POAL|nr:hypothetical protein HU200_022390 [Digitaria exilis]CAB3494302.1 unnamed protein product [Digitaria exilis]
MRGASQWHSHRSKRAPFDDAALSFAGDKLPWPSPRRPDNHAVLLSGLCFLFRFGQEYSTVDGLASMMPTGAVVSATTAVAPARQQGGARNAGAGHPPLPRPPPRQCPRCQSGNTKFCYYNNYSRAQPRYLCKACRRHWTEGGTLRDVPVGGGRKNRRGGGGNKGGGSAAKAAASASSSSAAATQQGGSIGADMDLLLRQLVQFQPAAGVGVGGGGYAIHLSAWQQMAAAATAPAQGNGDVGALGGAAATAAEANCGALPYWGGWQQDDMPGLDGAC